MTQVATPMSSGDDFDAEVGNGQFQCPICNSFERAIWAFPHPLIVHWVLNPGLAVNELLLGQRIPKITYFCKLCGSDMTYFRYYQCPDCLRFHEEAIWTGSNGFGHWLGLICPDCGGEIPCVLNVVSWVILARLSPINWMLRLLFGRKYLAWEQTRAAESRRQLEKHRQHRPELVADEVVDSLPKTSNMV